MTTAKRYAHLLYRAATEEPHQAPEVLRDLIALLKARRLEKLLPRVYAEFQKLVLRRERSERRTQATPEHERTRVLLELYRTLISNN